MEQGRRGDILEWIMDDTINTPAQSMSISIPEEKRRRNFRSQSEMKEGHGCVEGVITIEPPPSPAKVQRLEMSLVPSENCVQAQHLIHPNIPFLSIRQSKKRGSKYHTDLTSPKAWKVVFLIRNGTVFYKNEITGEEIKVHELKNGNQIIMGRHFLEMTIITPLQSNNKSQGLSVESVITDRVQFDFNSPQKGMINSANITKQFIGSHANDEMKRCRIRLCLYEDESDRLKCAEVISKNICDSKNKNFGNFEIATMSKPHKCCNKGGWQIFLVSKSKVGPSGCYPIFVAADPDTQDNIRRVEKCFTNFKQISKFEIMNNCVFIFDVPAQSANVIRSLKEFHDKIYVTLYRESDGEFAANMQKFDYEVHEEHNDECPYCSITHLDGYEAPRSMSFRKSPKRAKFVDVPHRERQMSTTSGVSSPGSIYADESNSVHEAPSGFDMPVISDEEAGQILQSLDITPNAQGIIDIGLGEFESPSVTISGFDLSKFGTDTVCDGPSTEYTEESDTETYSDTSYYTTTESESEESEIEQLCSNTEKLNVKNEK